MHEHLEFPYDLGRGITCYARLQVDAELYAAALPRTVRMGPEGEPLWHNRTRRGNARAALHIESIQVLHCTALHCH